MSFESLSFKHTFIVKDFPERWINITHLFDPDLPSFPVYYFHSLLELAPGQRPSYSNRIFGYVEKLHSIGNDTAEVVIVTNKDLSQPQNAKYAFTAEYEVLQRFGLVNPIVYSDISSVFSIPLDDANLVIQEIWHRVITDAYGNKLPFGILWDKVLGLTRFVASFNSDKGRKGELIQTHYFCSKFGVSISTGANIQKVDFFLLPTHEELFDASNPLTIFPEYARLVDFALAFHNGHCVVVNVGTGSLRLSKFNHPRGTGAFNTAKYLTIVSNLPPQLRKYGIECFNAFYKGPARTLIYLLMLNDLRNKRLDPPQLTDADLVNIQDGLSGTYQAPKVIHIYAQQCYGNVDAIPDDLWVKIFMKWPLNIHKDTQGLFKKLLPYSRNIGKLERLIWVAAQSRKIHSSACNDALWCIKKASEDSRAANPLACKNCILKSSCPAFAAIKKQTIVFNSNPLPGQFTIKTSAGDNTTPNQTFISCSGRSIYEDIFDDFSPIDVPEGFSYFPNPSHGGVPLTVEDFMKLY